MNETKKSQPRSSQQYSQFGKDLKIGQINDRAHNYLKLQKLLQNFSKIFSFSDFDCWFCPIPLYVNSVRCRQRSISVVNFLFFIHPQSFSPLFKNNCGDGSNYFFFSSVFKKYFFRTNFLPWEFCSGFGIGIYLCVFIFLQK